MLEATRNQLHQAEPQYADAVHGLQKELAQLELQQQPQQEQQEEETVKHQTVADLKDPITDAAKISHRAQQGGTPLTADLRAAATA